ncbi:unnamed protein product [Phytophthora lilii]|uniref:Unnamed protein product n=1 Tax=Phytophthora lilii TaxID=2077276 RepID=A0A9W6UE02_9STRA|nr:unnamed protein product [Phytophthora lilii]
MMAMVKIRVEFSGNGPKSMMELGLACVSQVGVEPPERLATMQSENVFSDSSCSSVPVSMSMVASSSCIASDCTTTYIGTQMYYYTTTCPSDSKSYAASTYGSTKYLLVDVYSETECTTYAGTAVVAATGTCEVIGTTGQGIITTVFSNGSAQLEYYMDSSCQYSSSSPYMISKDLLSSHACFQGFKLYSNSGGSSTSGTSGTSGTGGVGGTTGSGSSDSSGLGIGVIIGIIAGVLVLLVIAGLLCWRCRKSKGKQEQQQVQTPGAFEQAVASSDQFYRVPVTPQKTGTASTTLASSDGTIPSKLWDDEAIVAARIPREKVVVERLINRGGFGEVYAGTYNGQQVAVKMLLPERKKSLTQVNAFLSEVKLMTTLDHPHIVEFIGVAWDSLTDLCVVTEYMTIDLKALLTKFEEQRLPVGFDHDKVKVALHVAHALTYLHSCAPPVIHRDLKSSNILLNETMDAKVTDFGISRERIDATMTAGVGTSLWMAPEVMLGERYDDKADMFSFGVVLSELDLHALPYSHAKNNTHSGQRLTDTAILQMVAAGKLRVQFSQAAPESMVQLGLACVSTDPKQRPTAAEALYRLQTILAREIAKSPVPTGKALSLHCTRMGLHKWHITWMLCVIYPASSSYAVTEDDIKSHTCSSGRKFYSSSGGSETNGVGISSSSSTSSLSASTDGDGGSGISGGAIVGIIVGVLFVVVLVGVLVYRRCRRRQSTNQGQAPPDFSRTINANDAFYEAQPSPAKIRSQATTTISDSGRRSSTRLWDDDVIVAARIPREKVTLNRLINRGGYGEVYIGSYHGEQVAVKMLLPETKKTMSQVNAFLLEVKLMASLDHPRIVSFVGVAWDQLIDICVVSEYMAGGDLKALLTEFDKENRPVGFNHDKVKIALDVAIALTYLHSCAPPVIHRDLKSKNILLDEVMMGERYDDKADMFSFGVVLSELDSQVTPYSNAKSNSTTSSTSSQQNKLPSAAILQMVAAGKLRVQFSEAGPQSMIDLGLACVSLDPKQRPTAAEALYKLQKILAKEV